MSAPSPEPTARRLDSALLAALFVLTPLLVYPWRFIAEGMMQLGGDDMLSNLPMLRHSAGKLLAGELLWTPDLWLGYPLLGEPEFAVLYPFRLVMLLFEPVTGFAVYVYAHLVFAQLTFFLMGRSFGLSRVAAIFGAVGYAFGGFMLAHRGHTMFLSAGTFAPLFIALLQRALARSSNGGGGRWTYLGAALAFAAVPFSGAVQLTAYLVLTAILLALTQALRGRTWSPLRVTLLALVPGALITALLAIPALALTREATLGARQTYAFNVMLSWHPALLPSLFNLTPVNIEVWFHFGVAVLACATVGLLTVRKNPSVLAWSVVAGVALLLVLGDLVPLLQRALYHLPVIGQTFRGPARHGFELTLAVAMLAGFGLDRIRAGPLPGRLVTWALGGLGFIVGSTWLAKLAAARLSSPQLDPIGMMNPIARLTTVDVIAPVAFLLGWLLCTWLARRAPRLAAGALSLLALTEAMLLLRDPLGAVPNARAEVRELVAAAPSGARLMTHPAFVGLSTISLNASLLVPGLQQLTGYASIAPREMADLLELDMHGLPMGPEDLRWSRLPAILGVTHRVEPSAVCDPLPFLRGGPGCGQGVMSLRAGEEGRCPAVLGYRAPIGENLSGRLEGSSPTRIRLDLGYRQMERVFRWTSSVVLAKPGLFVAGISAPWSPLPSSYDLVLRADKPVRLSSVQLRTHLEPLAALAPAPVPAELRLPGSSQDGPRRSLGSQAIWQRGAVATPGGEVRFGDHSEIGLTVAAPRRPLRITLTGERAGPGREAPLVSLQISGPDHYTGRSNLLMAKPTALLAAPGEQLRRTWTVTAPADLPWVDLIVQPSAALRDVTLSLESACGRSRQPGRYLGNGLWLQRDSAALPRVYSVQRLLQASGVMPAARLLADSPELEPGKTATVDPAGATLPPRLGVARIEKQRFADRQVELSVEAAHGGSFVVVNDRFDPGWRATIDGQPAPIFRTNAVVRGLLVPEGRHVIRLWYPIPGSVYLGVACALLGLLGALALDLRARRAARSGSAVAITPRSP